MDNSLDKKVVRKLLIAAGVVLFICVLFTFIHVNDVRKYYYNLVQEELSAHLDVASATINNKAEEMKDIVTSLSGEITENNNGKEAVEILKKYSEEYQDMNIRYVTSDGKMYDAVGIHTDKSLYEEISAYNASSYSAGYFSNCYKLDENSAYIRGVYRFRIGDEKVYNYIVADSNIDDVFNDAEFSVLRDLSYVCIINRDGEMVKESGNLVRDYPSEHNVFELLKDSVKDTAYQAKRVDTFRNKFVSERLSDMTLSDNNGEKIYLSIKEVVKTNSMYIVAFYKDSYVDARVNNIVVRSMLFCLVIIVALTTYIIIIWARSTKVRNVMDSLAYRDDVTGGYNYNYFRRNAPLIIQENSEEHYVICRYDIHNFRYINEAYGHRKADEILKACIAEFNKIFSKERELCVRINSDQFLALMINDIEFAEKNQKYSKAVVDAAIDQGVKYPIRFKMGIYQVRKEDRDIDIMIDHANVARKNLKGDEKVLEKTYSDSIIVEMKKVDFIESEMKKALASGEFKVFLQPKWDIVNNHVIGAEALIRWVRSDGSMVYPSDFISVFERNGFIENIDFYMLDKVCELISKLESDPLHFNVYPVSVNQSRILINNPDYISNVEKVVDKYSIDVSKIEVEITETVFFDEKVKMLEVCKNLKALNFKLDMDDFGSGYSSLSILKDIPFDILKIDQEFFSEAQTSAKTKVIMSKILEMAEGLSVDVICEGVETEEQVKTLKDLGCKFVQGYYYGKPMPMEEFVEKYCVK